MARPGPAPKPRLQVVREGNPGRRPVKEGLKLPPKAPAEPDWREWFTVTSGPRSDENQVCRGIARATWRHVVPVLDAQGLLATIDATVLADLCVCVARIRLCERDISRRGLWVMGERGAVKNPSVTAANQYRTQLKFYVAELGLAPSSRGSLEPPKGGGDDDENPFDV